MELLKALLPGLIDIGVPIILTALAGVGGMLLDAMRRYFNNAAADRLLKRAERAASIAVHDIEQTMVPQLKRAAADGRITQDEARGLRQASVLRVKKVMGSKAMKQLGAEMKDDLEDVIGHLIESKVKQMRHKQERRARPKEDPTVPIGTPKEA